MSLAHGNQEGEGEGRRERGKQLPAPSAYTVREYDPFSEPQGWDPLAAVYDAYNAARPASVVRDLAYWRDYMSWRWGEWRALGNSTFLVAAPADEPNAICGYIIPKYYPETFIIAELGIEPAHAEALPALLAALMNETVRRGIAERFRVYVPSEAQVDGWLQQLFGETLRGGSYGAHAVYALDGQIKDGEVEAMFTAAGSRSWILDQF